MNILSLPIIRMNLYLYFFLFLLTFDLKSALCNENGNFCSNSNQSTFCLKSAYIQILSYNSLHPLLRIGCDRLVLSHYLSSQISLYGVRNLEMSIRFSQKSRPSERFHRPEISQIKAEISLHTNVKLICHKNVGLQ